MICGKHPPPYYLFFLIIDILSYNYPCRIESANAAALGKRGNDCLFTEGVLDGNMERSVGEAKEKGGGQAVGRKFPRQD
jgi:hypothetical protein